MFPGCRALAGTAKGVMFEAEFVDKGLWSDSSTILEAKWRESYVLDDKERRSVTDLFFWRFLGTISKFYVVVTTSSTSANVSRF